MKNSILLTLVFCILSQLAVAQDMAVPKPDEKTKALIDTFVSDRYQAIHDNDLKAFRAIIHPKSLECLDEVAPKYLEQVLSYSHSEGLRMYQTRPNWQEVDSSEFKSPKAAANVLSAEDMQKKDKTFLNALPKDKRFPTLPEKAIAEFQGIIAKPADLQGNVLIALNDGHYTEVRFCMSPDDVKHWSEWYEPRYGKDSKKR